MNLQQLENRIEKLKNKKGFKRSKILFIMPYPWDKLPYHERCEQARKHFSDKLPWHQEGVTWELTPEGKTAFIFWK